MEKEKIENPYAFPLGTDSSYGNKDCGGMTLRDYFAARAMNGVFSDRELHMAFVNDAKNEIQDFNPQKLNEKLAEEFYNIADAMLKKRLKETE